MGLVDLGGCIRLLVQTVATNVKCPFSRLRVDQYTAANAFQSIDIHVIGWREKDGDSEVDAGSEDPEKCTRQFAATVAKRVKYRSNLLQGNQSIVGNVGKSIGLLDGTGEQVSIDRSKKNHGWTNTARMRAMASHDRSI